MSCLAMQARFRAGYYLAPLAQLRQPKLCLDLATMPIPFIGTMLQPFYPGDVFTYSRSNVEDFHNMVRAAATVFVGILGLRECKRKCLSVARMRTV